MILPSAIRKKIQRYQYDQGMGRHNKKEVYQLGIQDLQALNTILGEHPFLMGNEPTSIDACGYAYIANILSAPIASPMTDYVKSQQNFVDYCARMKERFYK
jgi:glutathione S-transferase